MNDGKGRLTLSGVETKKNVQPRIFAEGRYVTSGAPRSGGLASVYRAREIESGDQIALKVFRPLSGTDDVVEESFKRETQALSDLKHENIVHILDAGYEPSTGEHFIAMEWVYQDLEVLRQTKKYLDWNHFYNEVGHYVLQALAFAHANAIVHRDIKPSNILITDEGLVKVCDFGISKIRNFLEPGVTLAHFASFPYAPPEPDDGSHSYSRDVFGFAATCVAVLSAHSIASHRELTTALEQLALDEPIRRLLRRSLSVDNPGDRPVNAVVLLAELERHIPRPKKTKAGSIQVALTKKVKDIISYDIGLQGDQAVEKYVVADLENAVCQFDSAPPPLVSNAAVGVERSIRLFGERYGYIAVRDGVQNQTLKLVSAFEPPPVELDRERENSCESPYEFAISGILPVKSSMNIVSLRSKLDEFSSEQKIAFIKHSQQQLYRTWIELLNAKTELEKSKKRMFRYEEIKSSGSLIEFKLAAGSDFEFLEDKDIRIESAHDGTFLGTVLGVERGVIAVQPSDRNRVEALGLPSTGMVGVDTAKADAALDKQKTAVDAVRYGRSIDPFLGDYIVDPPSVPVAVFPDLEFIQSQIDDDKKDATRAAMSGSPLMVVEGPPGTGKTTFITELVLQTLRQQPGARVLLTSQTHVALDNSLERITKESGGNVRAVRIGHEGDDRISATTKQLLVDRKLPVMRKQSISDGKKFIEVWAEKRGVDLSNTRMAMGLGRLANLRERLEDVSTSIEELRPILQEGEREKLDAGEREDLDDKLGGFVSEQAALERDLKDSMGEIRKYESDKDTIQHLANCSADELRNWADSYAPQTSDGLQLRKMLSAHADWETRFGRSREFKAALIASSQVVAGTCLGVMGVPGRNEISYDLCIVDEASIATPTEVLVPMSRARRTVLVGDNKQLSPFQDPELRSNGLLKKYQIDPKDQATTLFRHLTELLPEELRKTLSTQHRMLPAIGNLISECFYGGDLLSIDRKPDPVLAAAVKKPVVWRSTSRMPNRMSRKIGTSHVNGLEVELIVRLLTKLDFDMRHGKSKGEKRSVAVLTGYGEQKRSLHSAIDTRHDGWVSFSEIYVNVVDAFQGREADVVVFSVTRSEAKGLGFLREMERINVALSRGKEALIIVGDHSYCQQASDSNNPLKDVIDYIRRNPDECAIEEVAP